MEINFNLDTLLVKNLTPSEYCILSCLYSKEYDILEKCFFGAAPIISYEDLEDLERKGYVKLAYDELDFKKIHFRQPALDLFDHSSFKTKFAQLYSMYPMKVPDGRGGYRVLRAKNTDSADAKKAQEKFMLLARKNPTVVDKMIKGLEKQLDTTRGSLQYMQQFLVWMNNSTWEKYCDLEEESSEDSHRETL